MTLSAIVCLAVNALIITACLIIWTSRRLVVRDNVNLKTEWGTVFILVVALILSIHVVYGLTCIFRKYGLELGSVLVFLSYTLALLVFLIVLALKSQAWSDEKPPPLGWSGWACNLGGSIRLSSENEYRPTWAIYVSDEERVSIRIEGQFQTFFVLINVIYPHGVDFGPSYFIAKVKEFREYVLRDILLADKAGGIPANLFEKRVFVADRASLYVSNLEIIDVKVVLPVNEKLRSQKCTRIF